MKVALCAIAKMENNYIREWIEWYKNLGVDHIFLYDNNDIDGEKFEDIVQDYIDSEFVEIINFRGVEHPCQKEAYNDCYNKHKQEYDWFIFLDIDELLNLYGKSLKDFLNQEKFSKYQGIRIWWKLFDDNGLVKVENNNYNMRQRFTKESAYQFDRDDRGYQTKVIFRGGLDVHYEDSVHYPNNIKSICDSTGKKLEPKQNVLKYSFYDEAVIDHYIFKTIEEYITIKKLRGWPNQSAEKANKRLSLELFFKYNQCTEEKEKYAKQLLGIKDSNPEEWPVKNNVDILYIVGKGSRWRNNELKYSLRSIAKNGYNIRKIFICGHIPNFVNTNNVTCIPCEDPTTIKHYNMLYKIDKAIKSTDIGECNNGKFLVSSDDHFYIKPVNFDEYPIYWRGTDLPKEYDKENKYQVSLASTRKVLDEYNLTHHKFNLHRNTWFNIKLWKEPLFEQIKSKSLKVPEGLEPTAIMINYWLSVEPFTPQRCVDCKVELFKNRKELLNEIGDSECFSIYDNAIACGVDKYLRELFPDKCKYEK